MHGLVLLDRDRRPLRPAILWNDQRAAEACEAIRERMGGLERLVDASGNDAFPGFTAPKLLWVREHEPEIYSTTRRFGTVLENVVFDDQSRRLDLDDASKTENTRAAYPITHLPNIVADGCAGQPSNVVFLTADEADWITGSTLSINGGQHMF